MISVVICFLLLSLSAVFFSAETVNADEIMDELRALKARIGQLEKKLAAQEDKIVEQNSRMEKQVARIETQNMDIEEIRKLKDAIGNLEFYVGATSVVQGTFNNDRNLYKAPGIDEKGDDTDASYSVDIEITSKVGDHGKALLFLEAAEGEGLISEAGGLTGVNYDALDDVDLDVAEVWYEHSFLQDRLVTTVGKMDVTRWFDTNEVAGNECSQFLADVFVKNLALELPDGFYGYGARVGYYPNDLIELNIGYVASEDNLEDIFDNGLMIAEAKFKPKFGDLQGNYRFYVWRNSGEHEKLRDHWRTDKTGSGAGLSIDQQLSENLTAFCRLGQQSDDVYAVRRTWSAGFQLSGRLWGRQDDMFGIAYGAAESSGSYRELLRDAGFGTTPTESRVEAYYRYQVNDHLAISPDLQWVDGLAGASNSDAITILGVRAQLDF
jgi:high affinity Mn2+ porin